MMGLLSALPGAVAQGLIWAIMALGVYITYKILDIADLTVDGSICTGAAVCAVMILSGCPVWLSMLCAALSGVLAGLCTGLLHIALGIPAPGDEPVQIKATQGKSANPRQTRMNMRMPSRELLPASCRDAT